jgi:hypothetical protein
MSTQTFYKFDNWGWFNGESDVHVLRSTPIAPTTEFGFFGEPIEGNLWPMWCETHWRLSEYVAPAPAPVDMGKWFTWADFQRLFPFANRAAIFSSTDGGVIAFIELARAAGGCYIESQETIEGVDYLLSIGLIDESLRDYVLSGGITPD